MWGWGRPRSRRYHHYHHCQKRSVPNYGVLGGFGGLIDGLIGGAIGANLGHKKDQKVVVQQQPISPPIPNYPPPVQHKQDRDVHVHINQYGPPARSAPALIENNTNMQAAKDSGPSIQQIDSGLVSLERLMQIGNIEAAKLQIPAFKKWYFVEREKFTDFDLLGVYDTRLLTIDMWLVNGTAKLVNARHGPFTEHDAKRVIEHLATKDGQRQFAQMFQPAPIMEGNGCRDEGFKEAPFLRSLRNANVVHHNPASPNPAQAYPGLMMK